MIDDDQTIEQEQEWGEQLADDRLQERMKFLKKVLAKNPEAKMALKAADNKYVASIIGGTPADKVVRSLAAQGLVPYVGILQAFAAAVTWYFVAVMGKNFGISESVSKISVLSKFLASFALLIQIAALVFALLVIVVLITIITDPIGTFIKFTF